MREANFFLKSIVNVFGKHPKKLTGNIVYLATNPEVTFCVELLRDLCVKPPAKKKTPLPTNKSRLFGFLNILGD